MKTQLLDSWNWDSSRSSTTRDPGKDGKRRAGRRHVRRVFESLLLLAFMLVGLNAPLVTSQQAHADETPSPRELKVQDPTQVYYVGLQFRVTGVQQWRIYVPEGRKIALSCGASINGSEHRDLITKPLARIVLGKGESEVEINFRGYLAGDPDFTWRVRNIATGEETKTMIPLPKTYLAKFRTIQQSRTEQFFAPSETTRVRTSSPTYLFRTVFEPERSPASYANPMDIPQTFAVILHDLEVPFEASKR